MFCKKWIFRMVGIYFEYINSNVIMIVIVILFNLNLGFFFDFIEYF